MSVCHLQVDCFLPIVGKMFSAGGSVRLGIDYPWSRAVNAPNELGWCSQVVMTGRVYQAPDGCTGHLLTTCEHGPCSRTINTGSVYWVPVKTGHTRRQLNCPQVTAMQPFVKYFDHLFMVALWNSADHYIFALWFLSFFLLSFFLSSPWTDDKNHTWNMFYVHAKCKFLIFKFSKVMQQHT